MRYPNFPKQRGKRADATAPANSMKPWYKKRWGITLIVIAILAVIGTIGDIFSANAPVKTIPDTAGSSVAEAKATLRDAGFNNVNLRMADGTRAKENDSLEVTASKPAAGTELKTSKPVTLIVVEKPAVSETPSNEPSATETSSVQPSESPSAEKEPEPALSPTYARTFCERYAQQLTDEKLDFHWMMGKLAEKVQEDGSVFLKVQVTGTNAAKAKHEYEIECLVGGTNDRQEMLEFNAY